MTIDQLLAFILGLNTGALIFLAFVLLIRYFKGTPRVKHSRSGDEIVLVNKESKDSFVFRNDKYLGDFESSGERIEK